MRDIYIADMRREEKERKKAKRNDRGRMDGEGEEEEINFLHRSNFVVEVAFPIV